jgi:type I restriction enzyme M protein
MLRNGQLEYPSVQYVSGFTLRIIPEEDGLQVHVQELGQQIALERTRLHYGHRWWFVCPRCQERRAALYLSRLEGGFYCRGCLKLDYESSRRNHAYDRVYDQIAAGLTAKGEPTAAYDVYQHLMDYWAETMQDDCYLIAADGWKAETSRVLVKNNKGKEVDKGWTCDLVPKALIVARYFAAEQEVITKLEAELESLTAQMTEMEEEHGGDEGAFAELDKVNRAAVAARLRDLRFESGESVADEKAVLEKYLEHCERQADLKRALKQAEEKLDALAYARYPALSEAEIKTLVVNDKWLTSLDARIHGEMDRISQALTRRVKELAERYETPLPELTSRVDDLEQKVSRHLERMGFSWK